MLSMRFVVILKLLELHGFGIGPFMYGSIGGKC
jgi:hypothetical protein